MIDNLSRKNIRQNQSFVSKQEEFVRLSLDFSLKNSWFHKPGFLDNISAQNYTTD